MKRTTDSILHSAAARSTRREPPGALMKRLMAERGCIVAPGVYDPFTAQLAMYHRLDAAYLSGYSFSISHLGMPDLDLYTSVEMADVARRVTTALRRLQASMEIGDPTVGIAPAVLPIPPVLVDIDTGYGGLLNVQRTAELFASTGVAAVHIEDQAGPKRCGHLEGKSLVSSSAMCSKLRLLRATFDDSGREDLLIVARTDAYSAVRAPESERGLALAVERGLAYLDTGIPDLLWCEFPDPERAPLERFVGEIRKRFPDARFMFNYSSSFKWFEAVDPLTVSDLRDLGVVLVIVSMAAQHAAGEGVSALFRDMSERGESAYRDFQRAEWGRRPPNPTRNHHAFVGVPYYERLTAALETGAPASADEEVHGS